MKTRSTDIATTILYAGMWAAIVLGSGAAGWLIPHRAPACEIGADAPQPDMRAYRLGCQESLR